jgi:hypothetical protein
MKKVDAAWLAGLIDGDGCIYLSQGTGVRLTPRINISMTHLQTIKDVAKLTNVGSWCRASISKNAKNIKPIYKYEVVCNQAIHILKEIIPYLRTKKKQALLLLQVNKHQHERWRRGTSLTIKEKRQRQQWKTEMRGLNG